MGLVDALRSYEQADEDGAMCRVSRHAVDEGADAIAILERIVLTARKCEGDQAHRILPNLWPLIAEADKLFPKAG